jgi:1-acyl-sn-glycerol-3-phosphate acyltransferase
MEFVGETTLAESLWHVACGDGVVARLMLLAPRPSAGAERRELAAQLRADIAAALGIALQGGNGP